MGTGLDWVLRFQMTRGVASGWMLDRPGLAVLLNYATIVWELGFPLLIFTPWRNALGRILAASTLVAFQAGMLAFLVPGYFAVTATCMAIALLPGAALDALGLREPIALDESPARGRRRVAGALEVAVALIALCVCVQRSVYDVYQEHRFRLGGSAWVRAVDRWVERTAFPEEGLLRFLARRTVAYPMRSERLGYTVAPLGTTADGREWNLRSGAPDRSAVHVPVLWSRPYEAFLIDAWFGRINRRLYLRVKWGAMDRVLAEWARDWNRAHADRRVVSARFELFVFDLAAPDPDRVVHNETLVRLDVARGPLDLDGILAQGAELRQRGDAPLRP